MAKRKYQVKFFDINTIEDMEKGIINLPPINEETIITLSNVKNICGLHFTTNHTAKMGGMISLSTLCKVNPHCIKNHAVKGSICEECFSFKQMNVFTNQEKPLYTNTLILNNIELPMEYLPLINALYFRFEAFGDLASEIQVYNYFNICNKNPKTTFTLWTKNPIYIKKAIENGYKKPSNLIIIQSAMFINKEIKPSYDFIDKVFVVYDEEGKADHIINCGAKNCMNCLICYTENDIEVINEELK